MDYANVDFEELVDSDILFLLTAPTLSQLDYSSEDVCARGNQRKAFIAFSSISALHPMSYHYSNYHY